MPRSPFDPARLLESVLLQRIILAFTTGLFLACAANVSASSPF